MVNQSDSPEDEAELEADCVRLLEDVQELRRIGGLNIVRAAHIGDVHGDAEVARLLISEASVMLSVASQIEHLIGEPPKNEDVNL